MSIRAVIENGVSMLFIAALIWVAFNVEYGVGWIMFGFALLSACSVGGVKR